MGLAEQVIAHNHLVTLDENRVRDIAGVSMQDVLAYLKENEIIKIVAMSEPNKYRLVFPLPDKDVYEVVLKQK